MSYIRQVYGVPAKRGGKVRYTGGKAVETGTIKSACGNYLKIQMDGAKSVLPFHPTWQLDYL